MRLTSTLESEPVGGAPRLTRRRWLRAGVLFAGDRRVWVAAGITSAAMVGLIGWQLAKPRDLYTGTNSVGVRNQVAQVPGGRSLCIPGLTIPGGSGRVELDLATPMPRPRLDLEVRTASGTFRGFDPGAPTAGQTRLQIPIEPTPARPATQLGTVCVRPRRGPVFFDGTAGLGGNDVPPRVGGQTIAGRVAVWFRRPTGERRSYVSQLGPIVHRAALFRPGLVGTWTYALLLAVVLPALWLSAIRLLAVAGSRSRRRLLATTAFIAFVNFVAWALITPAFDAPDETEHFAYAQYLAETGKAPARSPDKRTALSEQQAIAAEAVHIYSYDAAPDGRPPWTRSAEREWETRKARLGHDPARANGGGATTATTHAPLYYGLLAPGYLASRGQSPFSQLTAMRVSSALLATVSVIFAFLILTELFPRFPVAWVGGALLIAFEPMFGFISGAVNNDNGVNAATAAILYGLVLALRRGLTVPLGAATGVLLALAPLLKGTAYTFYVVAAIAIVLLLTKQQRRLTPVAALGAAFLITGALWTLLSGVFDRDTLTTPSGDSPVTSVSILHHPSVYLSYLWQIFLPPLWFMSDHHREAWPFFHIYVERVWGTFGWIAVLFPHWVYVTILSAMAAVGALGLAALWRERVAVRARWREAVLMLAAVIGVVMAVEAAFATFSARPAIAEQGRYVFTAIPAYTALVVFACFALGRRRVGPVLAVFVSLVIGVSVASQLLMLADSFS